MRFRTERLSFPQGCTTVAFQPGLTGLIVEDVLIPAEEESTLMISNPGMSPIRLQGGLALGKAQPVDWLRDFMEQKNTSPTEDVAGSGQPEGLNVHQDVVCGVVGRENPLFALTRKDAAFNWDESCQQAFDQLRMY